MKRFLPILFVLLLVPVTMFAQARKFDENAILAKLGLNDTQISQVVALQKSTRATARMGFANIRLIKAQIAVALLAANPDEQAINALIEKRGQLRNDIEKNRVSARLQLVKIVGADNFAKIARFIGRPRHHRFQHWRNGKTFGRPQFMPENSTLDNQ